MTVLVQNIRRYTPLIALPQLQAFHKRVIAVSVLLMVALLFPSSWEAAIEALSDAYLAVSVFVAGTLALVFAAERAFKTDLGAWLQKYQRWQVPAAALLGAFPGCGGAIIAITQYTRGYLSFGGVVATLTATMGDAMFLLLAREPQTAVGILALAIIVGTISGYIVDAIHGPGFMRSKKSNTSDKTAPRNYDQRNSATNLSQTERLWITLIVPGVVMGLLGAFQVDVDEWLTQWTTASPALLLGISGAVLAVAMWVRQGGEQTTQGCDNREQCQVQQPSMAQSVMRTTNFVTAWVVFAFVGYEVLIAATGVNLANAFSVWGPLVPAIAVLIGFVPGCGPQLLVTSFYLSGAIPLSAQLANAMANDGDALFPAIAAAPKAAMVATLYSAIPALIVGYGWYFIME